MVWVDGIRFVVGDVGTANGIEKAGFSTESAI